ncbi:MAG: Gfo/Idh/MocA family oxidoreductase [Bacteroidota bacterium]
MRVLIIGLGSIAKKHINALKRIYTDVTIFALRSGDTPERVEGVINISSVNDCPAIDFIIISNPTAFHAEAIKQVVHLKKPLFIEKPPFHTLEHTNDILAMISENEIITYTAFNLRFLDCLIYLKKNIDLNKVQEVNVYCGSFLPNWRSNTDYKKNYSANVSMGGGAHLDLIHELDYVLWIFGKPLEVKSTFRSNSKIGIDAVDYANYMLIYGGFAVNIILNYYRQDTKRTCEIVMDDDTWNANLITNTITSYKNNTTIIESEQTVLDTYTDQMNYFCSCIKENKEPSNSLTESVNTLKIALS